MVSMVLVSTSNRGIGGNDEKTIYHTYILRISYDDLDSASETNLVKSAGATFRQAECDPNL